MYKQLLISCKLFRKLNGCLYHFTILQYYNRNLCNELYVGEHFYEVGFSKRAKRKLDFVRVCSDLFNIYVLCDPQFPTWCSLELKNRTTLCSYFSIQELSITESMIVCIFANNSMRTLTTLNIQKFACTQPWDDWIKRRRDRLAQRFLIWLLTRWWLGRSQCSPSDSWASSGPMHRYRAWSLRQGPSRQSGIRVL